jgi:hypothetical protein
VAPIEVFFGVIVFIFALIGIVRGFLRELGVTLVLMFLLYFLSRFEPFLDTGLVKVMDMGGATLRGTSKELLKCWIFLFVIIGAAFVSYEGETLAYGGEAPRGGQGVVLGVVAGTLNGYLIAGTIWFYMDKFGYPIKWLGFAADKLSPLAKGLADYLPISFLGQPLLLGQSLLLYLAIVLLIARVVR